MISNCKYFQVKFWLCMLNLKHAVRRTSFDVYIGPDGAQ